MLGLDFNLKDFLNQGTDRLNAGLDAGSVSQFGFRDQGMNLGQGFNSQGFNLGVNPLSVAQTEGQLVPGSIGSKEGGQVTSGELGLERKALGSASNTKSALGEVLLKGGETLSKGKGKSSITVSGSSAGGGQLGTGLRFEDLYGVKF